MKGGKHAAFQPATGITSFGFLWGIQPWLHSCTFFCFGIWVMFQLKCKERNMMGIELDWIIEHFFNYSNDWCRTTFCCFWDLVWSCESFNLHERKLMEVNGTQRKWGERKRREIANPSEVGLLSVPIILGGHLPLFTIPLLITTLNCIENNSGWIILYTPEDPHGTWKWRFGNVWEDDFPFLIGWFLGSMLKHLGESSIFHLQLKYSWSLSEDSFRSYRSITSGPRWTQFTYPIQVCSWKDGWMDDGLEMLVISHPFEKTWR